MEFLPNEILLKIFTQLPQRQLVIICLTVCKKWNQAIKQPWLFSTIHIYSTQQLKKVKLLADKARLIHGEPISSYVKCLKFHFMPQVNGMKEMMDLFMFPFLQSFEEPENGVFAAKRYKSVHNQLIEPTNFTLFGCRKG
ncbi:unnamed protein product [Cunninghamella blakesleeana]